MPNVALRTGACASLKQGVSKIKNDKEVSARKHSTKGRVPEGLHVGYPVEGANHQCTLMVRS